MGSAWTVDSGRSIRWSATDETVVEGKRSNQVHGQWTCSKNNRRLNELSIASRDNLRDHALRNRDSQTRRKGSKPIPKQDAQRIAQAVFALEDGLTGDIKKLTRFSPEYRLRVGDWRILFEVLDDKIVIYRILHRKEVYR